MGETERERRPHKSFHPGQFTNSLLLFLGEGNFSFSTSLAQSSDFQTWNCHLIATDYAPELKEVFQDVDNNVSSLSWEDGTKCTNSHESMLKTNIATLRQCGHQVFCDVDATKLHEHKTICEQLTKFSRVFVIFNFPHAKSKKMKIDLNRGLLRDFFMSCEKCIEQNKSRNLEIIPVVSLCAGQCGIPDVDVINRSWGDSWQINDMAAHGNFVCTQICKFEEYKLYKACKLSSGESHQIYQSSFYRLQGASSFTTTDALTFIYQPRPPIDPCLTNRLTSVLRITQSIKHDVPEHVSNFLQHFSPLTGERIISFRDKFTDFSKQKLGFRPYFHVVTFSDENPCDTIQSYLGISSILKVLPDTKEICAKMENDDNFTIVGESIDDSTVLYVDRLLELKYKTDYRTIMSTFFEEKVILKSLYPRAHDFHISFWLNEKFTMDAFLHVLLNVYGLMLESLEFVEEYVNNEGRKSTCWRIQVRSLDYPLSRTTAHQLYLQLRQQLAEQLNVDVR